MFDAPRQAARRAVRLEQVSAQAVREPDEVEPWMSCRFAGTAPRLPFVVKHTEAYRRATRDQSREPRRRNDRVECVRSCRPRRRRRSRVSRIEGRPDLHASPFQCFDESHIDERNALRGIGRKVPLRHAITREIAEHEASRRPPDPDSRSQPAERSRRCWCAEPACRTDRAGRSAAASERSVPPYARAVVAEICCDLRSAIPCADDQHAAADVRRGVRSTRLSASSRPAKISRPGHGGTIGWRYWPVAITTTRPCQRVAARLDRPSVRTTCRPLIESLRTVDAGARRAN